MSQSETNVLSTEVRGDTIETVFLVPAFTRTGAKQQGKARAALKGFSNTRVESVELDEDDEDGLRNSYTVTVLSDR